MDNTVNFSMPRQAAELRAQSPTADFSFGDLIDIVNPLQHIPIVSKIYRNLTGDKVAQPAAQVIGDGIYGGPIGALIGVMTAMISGGSETDPLEMAWNYLTGDDDQTPTDTMVAQTETAPIMQVAADNAEDGMDLAQTEQAIQSQKKQNIQLASDENAVSPLAIAIAPLPKPKDSSLLSLVSVPLNSAAPKLTEDNAAAATTEVAANQPSPLINKLRRAGLSPYQNGVSMPANYVATATNQRILTDKNKPLIPAKTISAVFAGEDASDANLSQPLMPANDFSQKMMQALDRYKANAQAGQASQANLPTLNSY